jgi:two-component system OmpR family sensor kinase
MVLVIANLLIYRGYNIKKQEQIDIQTHKYLSALFKSHKNIIRKELSNKSAPLLRDDPLEINRKIQKFINGRELRLEFKIKRPPRPPRHHVEITKENLNEELEKYDLQISEVSLQDIQNKAKLIASEDDWKLYRFKGHLYFHYFDKRRSFLVKDMVSKEDKEREILLLTLLLNVVFISFYIFLIKRLIPLKALKEDIQRFSNGELDLDTSAKGKDEISDVANEFNNALTQIRNLSESRNLFLRNIMHEFKTPITRGFIIADMMEGHKYHGNLKKAFERLEYLLSELARLEMFTSNNVKLNKKDFTIYDILDNTLDILLLDKENIEINELDEEIKHINVDFEFFSIAIKNLIDNAIKYGEEKPIVTIDKDSISIKSKGNELEKPLEEYFKPFNRAYESSTKSLGLGLYIVHSILKAHDFTLGHSYEDGYNIFSIKYKVKA